MESDSVGQAQPAYLQTLIDIYEQARSDGLCPAGAWEVARDQIAPDQLAAILQQYPDLPRALALETVDWLSILHTRGARQEADRIR
jgi:hypothetical protein